MPTRTVQDVVRGTEGALVGGDLNVPVAGVSIDSRTLHVGEVFFAIHGQRLDGHRYLPDAVARGASCLVVDTLPDELPSSVSAVLVDDTTKALGRFAAYHRARYTLPVAAVTGSNGKTTTKEMMASVLGALGPVLKPESSFNNQWGLPLTLLRLGPEHRAVALELGANQPGEIATLAAISRPSVGVVTVVASAHTEFFGSLDGVQAEKSALVRALPPEGTAVLNADDSRVLAMRDLARCPVLTFSARADADVRAVGPVDETADGIRFTLEIGGVRQSVRMVFAGRHNVTNALAAAGVGLAIGIDAGQIVAGLEAARPAKGRTVWRRAGPLRVLDDTYNANPSSMAAALETLSAGAGERRRVVVLGDMLELGEIAEHAHREVGRAVARSGAAEFIAMGQHARVAVEAAREAGLHESHHATTFEDTVALLLKRLTPNDAVLVKGSRGMRMERVVDALIARLGDGDG
ncbi:MAG TPA: UDP-N-acetylmuramoyl-tripeptide--D-alanyl-D-alanine ligase [Candidatus Methylomirabilis sp.]|nr:UDP-N-acetylmuramoyl-tripeptide--D-alanyl-D-alanine ligase [Candidatus Methylomirabilis sp.]